MDILPHHKRDDDWPFICDFCNAPGAVTLDIPDFPMGHGLRSTGGWMVCMMCAHLVHIEDAVGLLTRARESLSSSMSMFGGVPEKFEQLHARFWAAYHKKRLTDVSRAANTFVSSVKNLTPPWTEAIEAQFAALTTLEKTAAIKAAAIKARINVGKRLSYATANDANDMATLKVAETYSFSGNALEAIKQLAQKVPHDSPLHSSQIPGIGQGWWWFTPPLDVESNTFSKQVHGLLWGFVQPKSQPDLRKYQRDENTLVIPAGSPIEDVDALLAGSANTFITLTAFTKTDVHGVSTLLPSTSFRWFPGESIHNMLARTTLEYRKTYGPGGVFEHDKDTMGEEHHLKVVAELALFFLAACVWLEQDYLEVEHKPVERHRRKAFAREHKLDKPPATVRVIALRKRRASDSVDPSEPGEHVGHRLTVQFICSGYLRNQPYGPGRMMKKLIFVEPFRKGPKDAPWKPLTKKVFAVIR